jgi:hypothetical protein
MPGPFLGNGSVNTFPQQRIDAQQKRYIWKKGASLLSVTRSYLEDNWGDQVSSVRASVKKGLERVKLKYLHPYKPLPGKGW